MNTTIRMLHLHRAKLAIAAATLLLLLGLNLLLADLKPWSELNWVDVIGEGGTAALIGVWLVLILASRPAGRVTGYLFWGLLALSAAFFEDFADELFASAGAWTVMDNIVESGLGLVGFGLLTLGIFHLHCEQIALVEQLRRRERDVREHEQLDSVTRLGDASYWRRQLLAEEGRRQRDGVPFSILVVDVDGFNALARRLGGADSDRLLRELGEILLLNLRPQDLLCRYAGDRYVVLLPGADAQAAGELSDQLTLAARHFAFKSAQPSQTVHHSVSIGVAVADGESGESLMARATRALETAKQEAPGHWRLAA